jgi:hypothetical protein
LAGAWQERCGIGAAHDCNHSRRRFAGFAAGQSLRLRFFTPCPGANPSVNFDSSSRDAVILFKTPAREGIHIEDVK